MSNCSKKVGVKTKRKYNSHISMSDDTSSESTDGGVGIKPKHGCCSLVVKITDLDDFCYRVDRTALVAFAVAFFIYNIAYIVVQFS